MSRLHFRIHSAQTEIRAKNKAKKGSTSQNDIGQAHHMFSQFLNQQKIFTKFSFFYFSKG